MEGEMEVQIPMDLHGRHNRTITSQGIGGIRAGGEECAEGLGRSGSFPVTSPRAAGMTGHHEPVGNLTIASKAIIIRILLKVMLLA
jgi:hypothetical protein